MDQWLAAIEADASSNPLPVKVVTNKPAAAVDTCLIAGQQVTDNAVATQPFQITLTRVK
jgi:hypothetical protein